MPGPRASAQQVLDRSVADKFSWGRGVGHGATDTAPMADRVPRDAVFGVLVYQFACQHKVKARRALWRGRTAERLPRRPPIDGEHLRCIQQRPTPVSCGAAARCNGLSRFSTRCSGTIRIVRLIHGLGK
jgi:hypothetical protein